MTASKTKHRESTLWQGKYWEHQIRDDVDYTNHMDYLHYNSFKHGLTKQVKVWPYSTFHRYAQNGVYSENWAMQVYWMKVDFGEV